ncbi:MAG: type II toxin-antitoxin system VapC family toxin [Chloroflexota bacterium]
MKSRILLDTNAYSDLMRGNEQILDMLSISQRVYMSVIVLGELYTGFKGGAYEQKNRDTLKKFLARPTVRTVHVTVETADIFSNLMLSLKQNGTKIPINDVWIAAHALEIGARLVTRDQHFMSVAGLRTAFI